MPLCRVIWLVATKHLSIRDRVGAMTGIGAFASSADAKANDKVCPKQTSMLTMTIEDVGSTCAVLLQHSRQRFGMGRQLYEASGRRRPALD